MSTSRARPDARQGGRAVRRRAAVRRRIEHGQAAGGPMLPGRRPTRPCRRSADSGFAAEYDVERKFRECRLYQVAPISTNLILSYIGQHVLGFAAIVLMGALPLEGVTVVSLEQAVAAPFATRQLADLGARVIKVERPRGLATSRGCTTPRSAGCRAISCGSNRSKESLTLDLQAPAGGRSAAAADRPRRTCFRPETSRRAPRNGSASRRTSLRADHPRLIVCGLSGYGASGPVPRPQGVTTCSCRPSRGVVSITGTPEEWREARDPGGRPGGRHVRLHRNPHDAVCTGADRRGGVHRGLDARGRSANGWDSRCTTPCTAAPRRRAAAARHATIAPYGPYACAGGGSGAGRRPERARVGPFLRGGAAPAGRLAADPRFDTSARRGANREALDREIDGVFSVLTAAGGHRAAGTRRGIANAGSTRWSSSRPTRSSPRATAGERWRTSAGPVRSLIPPATIDGVEPRMERVSRAGRRIPNRFLRELGYGAATVAAWRAEGIV